MNTNVRINAPFLCQRVIREYGQRRLKEIEVHRQKMKFPTPEFQTRWSPTSPARYLRGSPSQLERTHKNRKSLGVPVNSASKRKSKRKKFVGAMKELALKTAYKRDSTNSVDSAALNEEEQSDRWPVLASLAHGDVIAIKENHTQRKYSFPTIVEKAMDANRKGLLFSEKNKVADSSSSLVANCVNNLDIKDCEIKRNSEIRENGSIKKESERVTDFSNTLDQSSLSRDRDGIENDNKRYRD